MDYKSLKDAHYNFFYMFSEEEINQKYNKNNSVVALVSLGLRYLASSIYSILFIPVSLSSIFLQNRNKILFYCGTKNNLDALKPIQVLLKSDTVMISNNYHLRKEAQLLITFIPYLVSFIFIPKFIKFYRQAPRFEQKILLAFFHQILYSFGYYQYCRLYLRQVKPRCIVFANDHTYHHRILVGLAEDAGIRCYYVQHASIGDAFPKIFSSRALLEGQHAMEKYLAVGSDEKRISLIGMTKFDGFLNQLNENPTVNKIGICTTRSMDLEETTNIITFLKKNFAQIPLVLRTHPTNESRQKYQGILDKYGLEFSDARRVDIFRYLMEVDAVISGNSSVLLEAALLNVFPIYIYGSKNKFILQTRSV